MEFRRPSYFALAALIDGPLHGYAIIQRAAELSEGSVRLSTGTLYALLDRAAAAGLVTAGEPYREGGRQRRDYRLTEAGRQELLQEAERLAAASAAVTGRLPARRRRRVSPLGPDASETSGHVLPSPTRPAGGLA